MTSQSGDCAPCGRSDEIARESDGTRAFKRSELPPAAGRDFLVKEMDLLQSVFNKYEEWIFRSRTALIIGIGALLSVAISKNEPSITEMALVLPVLSWLVEGGIRWDHWHGYVQRHYAIRDFLNSSDENSSISLYDLQNKLMPQLPNYRYRKLRSCFLSMDVFGFYLVVWLLTLFAFDMHDRIEKLF